jgi:hypothetical protein
MRRDNEAKCSFGMSVAIKTITNMVLISMQPFAVRKIFLLAVALLCLSSAFCFADSLFMARRYAPSKHENHGEVSVMIPVSTVLVDAGISAGRERRTSAIPLVTHTSVCLRRPVGFTPARPVDSADWPGFFFREAYPQSF